VDGSFEFNYIRKSEMAMRKAEDRWRMAEGGRLGRCEGENRSAKGRGHSEKSEYPPTVHSALGWCNHWFINQMAKFDNFVKSRISPFSGLPPTRKWQ
jgi:hypothetical protein